MANYEYTPGSGQPPVIAGTTPSANVPAGGQGPVVEGPSASSVPTTSGPGIYVVAALALAFCIWLAWALYGSVIEPYLIGPLVDEATSELESELGEGGVPAPGSFDGSYDTGYAT